LDQQIFELGGLRTFGQADLHDVPGAHDRHRSVEREANLHSFAIGPLRRKLQKFFEMILAI